jgi:hypothetical protein
MHIRKINPAKQNPLSEQAKSTKHVNKINQASKQNQLSKHAKSIRIKRASQLPPS